MVAGTWVNEIQYSIYRVIHQVREELLLTLNYELLWYSMYLY